VVLDLAVDCVDLAICVGQIHENPLRSLRHLVVRGGHLYEVRWGDSVFGGLCGIDESAKRS
jgi:hypothetical protein